MISTLSSEEITLSIRVTGYAFEARVYPQASGRGVRVPLARLAGEEQCGITLGGVKVETQGIALRYSMGPALDPILDDPRFTFARRCTYSAGHSRKSTRQIEITFRGLSPILDLCSWGMSNPSGDSPSNLCGASNVRPSGMPRSTAGPGNSTLFAADGTQPLRTFAL